MSLSSKAQSVCLMVNLENKKVIARVMVHIPISVVCHSKFGFIPPQYLQLLVSILHTNIQCVGVCASFSERSCLHLLL